MNIRNIINPIIANPPKANIPANITGAKPYLVSIASIKILILAIVVL